MDWLLVGVLQPKHHHGAFPWADFCLDTAFAGLFVTLAVRSHRTWLVAMAAFLVLGVANYATYATDMRGWHRAFMSASYLWGFGALLCLFLGARSDRARARAPAAASSG